MIEKILYDFLSNATDIPVYTEIPADKPSRFYAFEKTGSTLKDHIEKSTIAVQSWGESLLDAAQMNKDVISLMMNDLLVLPEIGGVSKNTDYNFTDPTTRRHRYQAVFVITTQGGI